jgi:hypothetical protein
MEQVKKLKILIGVMLCVMFFQCYVIIVTKKESFDLLDLYMADKRELVIENSMKDFQLAKKDAQIKQLVNIIKCNFNVCLPRI